MDPTPSPPRIAVSAYGDPRDPKTWSGTPANIIAALEKLGVEIVPINIIALSKPERLLYFSVYQVWRLALTMNIPVRRQLEIMRSPAKSDYNLMGVVHNRRARFLERQMRAKNVSQVIHMQPYAAPTGEWASDDIDHFLVFDTTYWTENAQQQTLEPDRRPQGILGSFRKTERSMFANLKHLFPVAEYLRDDLMSVYETPVTKVTAIGTGLGGLRPFRGEKDYRNGHILFVARQRFEEKGGALLLDAFRRAYQINPKLRLVLVGSEESRQKYCSVPGVTAYGAVEWNHLQKLFDTAALLAMPALIEPYGLVYQEALAGKTPILGLRRNAVPEFCDHGRYGFLVDRPDSQAVAETLLDAMSDPERLDRMGTEGQKYILDRYSWENTARRICAGIGITPQGRAEQ